MNAVEALAKTSGSDFAILHRHSPPCEPPHSPPLSAAPRSGRRDLMLA